MMRRAELAMAMFLIAAAVFFFLLIFAAAYFRALPHLNSTAGWVLTAVLIVGSLSMWRGWRWGTVALGLVFAIGLFATASAVLTVVHALFIIAGVIAVAVAPASALRAMSFYWYFFTAVWLVIIITATRL